ncbi:hypothetical protein GOBAR_DD29657 [Gossypium barbadense]|nr:hypothetical protein GOBAR_DD29657 [Gossypium barbadense]
MKSICEFKKRVCVIIPGNEIPEWFSQQRSGSVIEIHLPLNIQNDSQWIEVAFCCIFVNDGGSEKKGIGDRAYIDCRNSSYNGSVFQEDKCGECETKNLWTMDCSDHECHELQMSFQGTKKFPCVKVKKCGVRIMYEKDLEEIREVQCHITQSSPNFEHIHHHSTEKDGSAGSTSLVKRKRNIY